MAEKTIQEYLTSIEESLAGIVGACKGLPEDVIRWNPSEEEWSILQIVSHVNEATPYWLNEIKRVLEQPGCEWGRGLQHAARLDAVSKPDDLSVEKTLFGVMLLRDEVRAALGNLTEEQLKIESPHRNFAKFGNKPISFIIGHFIDEHLAGHKGQIQRNLSKFAEV